MEGFGLTFLEAASHGLPCLAGRSGGVGEAVLHGESGLLLPPDGGGAFHDAADRLLRDADELRRMSAAARRWADRHPWSATADCLRRVAGIQATPRAVAFQGSVSGF